MRTATTYRTFRTAKRQEIIDITDDVERCREAAPIDDGFVLISSRPVILSDTLLDYALAIQGGASS